MKKSSTIPSNYKTLSGLLKAVEKVLELKLHNHLRIAGTSSAMWLTNAEHVAKDKFGDENSVPALRKKYSVTRRQDLIGGDSLFGIELPKRDYIAGDNIPGVGTIDEVFGEQYFIGGEWFHKRCFESTTNA